MRLTDLHPVWIGHGGDGILGANGQPVPWREGVAIGFDCPCGCASPLCIYLKNPLDGGPPVDTMHHAWLRTGDTFDTLTLHPSIQRRQWQDHDGHTHGCTWHGWIRNGEVLPA